MRATRFWVVTHCVLLLASGTFLCCGNDEGSGGHPSSVGGANSGGEEQVGGVSSSTPTAGTQTGGSVLNGGTSPTPAGNGGVSETLGGAATAGATPIGGGGAGPLMGERLTLCDRLTQRSPHATSIALNYDKAVYADCRTRWVTNLYVVQAARPAFLNALRDWNLAFWGCGEGSVENFALVYGTPDLSAGDAAALIENYMTIASAELQLSPAEKADMQAALERLAQQDIADPSLELSGSLCEPAGSGGAGGAGGSGGDGLGGASAQGTAGASDVATAGHGGAP